MSSERAKVIDHCLACQWKKNWNNRKIEMKARYYSCSSNALLLLEVSKHTHVHKLIWLHAIELWIGLLVHWDMPCEKCVGQIMYVASKIHVCKNVTCCTVAG